MPKPVETCSMRRNNVGGYLHLATDEFSYIHEHLSTLYFLARGNKKVLEVGCGDSTFVFSQAISKTNIVESVDISQDRIDKFKESCPNNVEFFCQDSLEFDSPLFYDIIFIDGLHTYEQVTKEIEHFIPMLNFNGYIIFHDTNNPAHPGVRDAIKKSVLMSRAYEMTEWLHCNGLMVFKRL